MQIIKTDDFAKAFSKAPKEVQHLYTIQEKRFRENWRDPRLHIKKVRGFLFVLSFRVTRRYRVFFYFANSQTVIFFEMDHRKDIYKRL